LDEYITEHKGFGKLSQKKDNKNERPMSKNNERQRVINRERGRDRKKKEIKN
jgi:hypothetical protein